MAFHRINQLWVNTAHVDNISPQSEEFGLQRSFIADVERGSHSISIRNLLHVAAALGVSLPELLARLPSRA
jgi:hypothetical protein